MDVERPTEDAGQDQFWGRAFIGGAGPRGMDDTYNRNNVSQPLGYNPHAQMPSSHGDPNATRAGIHSMHRSADEGEVDPGDERVTNFADLGGGGPSPTEAMEAEEKTIDAMSPTRLYTFIRSIMDNPIFGNIPAFRQPADAAQRQKVLADLQWVMGQERMYGPENIDQRVTRSGREYGKKMVINIREHMNDTSPHQGSFVVEGGGGGGDGNGGGGSHRSSAGEGYGKRHTPIKGGGGYRVNSHGQYTTSMHRPEEVMRGGINTYAVLPGRQPEVKELDPLPQRLPTFLYRDDHPRPSVPFSKNARPYQGLIIRT